jgi:microcystin-dependent protein
MSTIYTFVGTGAQTLYPFDFDYLSKDFVYALVDGAEVDYTFQSPYVLTITPAPAVGTVVIVKRSTPADRLVQFVDGSILLAQDLNVAQLQAIHIAEEAADKASGSLLIDSSGAFSSGFRRISDVGDPTAARDAVNKQWAESAMTSQLVQATASQNAAATSATASATSAAAAAASKVAADTARSGAETALASANTAKAGADTAKAGADAAKGAAETARDTAYVYRTDAEAARNNSYTYRGEALGFRNEAEVFKNAAAESARVVDPFSFVPSGMVMPFAGSSAPAGWLKANGAVVSRTTYAALFATIGTIYGAGDGSTTFSLPDMRGMSVRGWADNRPDVDAGRVLGSYQADALAYHSHTFSATTSNGGDHAHTISVFAANGGSAGGYAPYTAGAGAAQYTTQSSGGHNHTVNGTTATAGTAWETRVKSVALLYCIKI